MFSTYRLKVEELNLNIIESIKTLYHDKEIEIIVHDIEDETQYLLKSEANRNHLLEAIKNVESSTNLIEIDKLS